MALVEYLAIVARLSTPTHLDMHFIHILKPHVSQPTLAPLY